MKYNFKSIEKKWQKYWTENNTYKTKIDLDKKKYYVMDMFPYPSGEGLHVGHPLGYIASDIYSRFKKLKGFNVLHPQGYDSFGLPAEQYAIQTGQHPKKTTEENINTYRNQLDKMGFSFDPLVPAQWCHARHEKLLYFRVYKREQRKEFLEYGRNEGGKRKCEMFSPTLPIRQFPYRVPVFLNHHPR